MKIRFHGQKWGGGKRAGGDMSHPVYILKEALFYRRQIFKIFSLGAKHDGASQSTLSFLTALYLSIKIKHIETRYRQSYKASKYSKGLKNMFSGNVWTINFWQTFRRAQALALKIMNN